MLFGLRNGFASDFEDFLSTALKSVSFFTLTCKHIVIWLCGSFPEVFRAADCDTSRQEAFDELGIQLYHL